MSLTLSLKHWAIGHLVRRRDPASTPTPRLVNGTGALKELGAAVSKLGMTKPMLVTDKILVKIGLVQKVIDRLDAAGIAYHLFDEVEPNPSRVTVDDGFDVYSKFGCDGLIAIGGGSPMDCAKIIGARVCAPGVPLEKMTSGPPGALRRAATKPYPPLVAIPTTAGTGSECTLAAVISFPKQGLKRSIADPLLCPKVAVLDPELTASLPPHITAATGMDALTHAVESVMSTFATDFTRRQAFRAVARIGRWLQRCYDAPDDLAARAEMATAAYEAGVAFTRTSVGYVHGVAHTFGGFFHVPHGVANAMVMPYVLDFYLRKGDASVVEKLCELAVAIGVIHHYDEQPTTAEGKRALAQAFIDEVRRMNAAMKVPTHVEQMEAADVGRVVARVMVESHEEGFIGYPVPVFMTPADCEVVVSACLPPEQRQQRQRQQARL